MGMRESGKSEKESRKDIDAVAASHILEQALMIEKNTEKLAGEALG